MAIPSPLPRLELPGFNHLTKTLSCNIYDIGYAATPEQQEHYTAYIDETYNTRRLTEILGDVSRIIGAKILNIAHHNYELQGASVTLLLCDEPLAAERIAHSASPGPMPDAVVCHLDKSHLTVHTYPESHPDHGVSTFRADIDVSTCGRISPLKALNYLIDRFKSDLVVLDYRVRGFTRDVNGKKHFIDHPLHSIQNFLSGDTRERYQMIDTNVYQERIFHTRMILKDFGLDNYLFGVSLADMPLHEQTAIKQQVRREMAEIFYSGNLHEELSMESLHPLA